MQTIAVIGTRAQAIKMAPVVRGIRQSGLTCEIVLTGQHTETVDDLLADFDLAPDYRLFHATEIKGIFLGLAWLPLALWRCSQHIRLRKQSQRVITVVHGDTVSTLIGALAGNINRTAVAHVEAGLRSGSLLSPFPEELIRRIVTSLSNTAYCPGQTAFDLMRHNKRVAAINTQENTVLDALRLVTESSGYQPTAEDSDTQPYVVISTHRLETIMNSKRLRTLVELVLKVSNLYTVKFILHPVTRSRLEATGHYESLAHDPAIEIVPRLPYRQFIHLAHHARAVLTDGGGNQEEMAYLGIPTLVLRQRTERHHGLEEQTHVVGLDGDAAINLLGTLNSPQPRLARHTSQPSARIADDLKTRFGA